MPEQISSYRLEEEIARGGMGIVYRGVHTVFDEVVAIKAIFPQLTLDPELRQRFLREAKIQRRLQHRNIVQIREFLIDQERFYIVMEFVEGETLEHRLRQLGGPMPTGEALDIFNQALEGLGFAHSQGVIHRDIKPSNIMLTTDGVTKLTDFGIARALVSDKLTRTGTALGTPAYMSPEQILGNKLDGRCDIYSMGITLYETLTGHMPFERPWHGESDFPVLAAHVSRPPTPPHNFVPDMPEALEAAIFRALEKEPVKRFASCQEFQAALVPTSLGPTRIVNVGVAPRVAGGKAGGPPRPAAPSPYKPELRPLPNRVPPPLPRHPIGMAQKPEGLSIGVGKLLIAGLILIVAELAWVSRPHPKPAPPRLSATLEDTGAPAKAAPLPAPNAGNPTSDSPNPAVGPTQIVVQTSPDAQIYLDDSFKGQAGAEGRLVIDGLAPGAHTLRASLPGKKDYEQLVSISNGQVAMFEVKLADAEKLVSPPMTETPRRPNPAARAGPIRENSRDGLSYVWIQPGTYAMGCAAWDIGCSIPERPPHQVTITRGFWIGQTPVTVGAYLRFARANSFRIPPAPRFNGGWANQNMPMVNVTWDEAQAYCQASGGRLPSEAEWEYAARGGSTEGHVSDLDEFAWYSLNSDHQTHDVAQKRANSFGLYDVLGNVWEWVNDWYDDHYYQSSPSEDPMGASGGQFRVMRGGSWSSNPRLVSFSFRSRMYPYARTAELGFRCKGDAGSP